MAGCKSHWRLFWHRVSCMLFANENFSAFVTDLIYGRNKTAEIFMNSFPFFPGKALISPISIPEQPLYKSHRIYSTVRVEQRYKLHNVRTYDSAWWWLGGDGRCSPVLIRPLRPKGSLAGETNKWTLFWTCPRLSTLLLVYCNPRAPFSRSLF